MKISPLFHPVTYKESYLEVLDETRLPEKQLYIKVRNLTQALFCLKEMKTRAYGQVLLFYYFLLLDAKQNKIKNSKQFNARLNFLTAKFLKARPTFGFAQFQNHLKYLAQGIKKEDDFLKGLEKGVISYIYSVERARLSRVKALCKLLPENPKIMTICNVSGELVVLAEELKKQGRYVEFFVSETRPYLQGSRISAWELNQAGFKVHLFSDIQAAVVFLKNNISAVVTGSDRSTREGDIINKIGTYSLAVLARHFNVPFYSFTQPPGATRSIKDIEIEFRPSEELLKFGNKLIAPKAQKALYPAFDITPAEYITKLICFDGVFSPEEFKKKWRK
ncbi:MAG: hypothetical protein PHU91_01745 [Candidatus Omnitrophica bacterium]|nr:hypothetical protein [Candidatus Omnitrophota bacterium]MDD5236378.1 hypothetical protein [Candidatus Omnitrophota bacterium]MDD5611393.1 hypothetical protein [Candidatus Omnitrophota bacterium]